jgi:DNA invertase Pin-like site-specific DNA recombinase
MSQALSYLRISGRGQINGDGFPRQREAIARYAKAHGIEVVGEYCDEGVNGTKDLDDRDGLIDLMARIRSNGVQLVLVERADGMACDLMVSEVLLAEFRKRGVTVIAADSGTDLTAGDDDSTRVLIRQVLGAVVQFEKSVIVAKLKAARIRKRKATGRCEGRKPFGTKPGEAETLGLIRRLRRKPRGGERLSYDAIAARLNEMGAPTRTGKPWMGPTVCGIVKRAALKRQNGRGRGSRRA